MVIEIQLPYLRTFPRWFPPANARGTLINILETEMAQTALEKWVVGERNEGIEASIGKDPEIAIQIASKKPPANPKELQNAILKRPLLAQRLARRAPWADQKQCALACGTNGELAWHFHNEFRNTDANISYQAFESGPHYAWRALEEFKLNTVHQEKLKAVTEGHALYRILSIPNSEERWKKCNKEQNEDRAKFLTYLLFAIASNKIDNANAADALREILAESDGLTNEEQEILVWCVGRPEILPHEATLLQTTLQTVYYQSPQWLYHLIMLRESDEIALMDTLLKAPNSRGWVMQACMDKPHLVNQDVIETIANEENGEQSPETARELLRWAAKLPRKNESREKD